MAQLENLDITPDVQPSQSPDTDVLARKDTVVWPKAFHQIAEPEKAHTHPPIRAKPQETEEEKAKDPYAYLMVCPVCDSVANSIKCKLVCPNCHTIVQSCCD